MQCMICKTTVDAGAKSCPHCGAMPCIIPQYFVNEESAVNWRNQYYFPQLARWKQLQSLRETVSRLQTTVESQKQTMISFRQTVDSQKQTISSLRQTVDSQHQIISEQQKRIEALEKAPKPQPAQQPASLFTAAALFGKTRSNVLLNMNSAGLDIKNNILYNYTGKEPHIIIPDGVVRIESNAFRNNTAIQTVVIPGTVRSIGACAFYGCTALSEVQIPDSVTQIEYSAFEGCYNLLSITIPRNCKTEYSSFEKSCEVIHR